jgi:antirestriction protein
MIPEAHQISRTLRDKRDTLRARLPLVGRRRSAHPSIQTLLQKHNVQEIGNLPLLYQAQARCHQEQARCHQAQAELLKTQLKTQTKELERALHPHLVPGAGDSGGKQALSHAGVRAIQDWAIQDYPVVRAIYEQKAREKPEAIARAIVAQEIARICRAEISAHVLRKREDFNGRFKRTPMSRQKKTSWPLRPRSNEPRRAASPTA